MLGYTCEELLARDVQQLTYPDELVADVRNFRRVLRGSSRRTSWKSAFVTAAGTPSGDTCRSR
jgi:hypothetical protein